MDTGPALAGVYVSPHSSLMSRSDSFPLIPLYDLEAFGLKTCLALVAGGWGGSEWR
jgi:hypothetical protein